MWFYRKKDDTLCTLRFQIMISSFWYNSPSMDSSLVKTAIINLLNFTTEILVLPFCYFTWMFDHHCAEWCTCREWRKVGTVALCAVGFIYKGQNHKSRNLPQRSCAQPKSDFRICAHNHDITDCVSDMPLTIVWYGNLKPTAHQYPLKMYQQNGVNLIWTWNGKERNCRCNFKKLY